MNSISALLSEAPQPLAIDKPAPPVPEKVEDTGLEFGFLADLTLKTVYSDAHCTTERAAEKLELPLTVAESLLQHLYREKLVEIRGLVSPHNYRYAILDRGWERVSRLLDVSGYIGPAPVSLASYNAMVQSQEKTKEAIKIESIHAALAHLVLSERTIQTLGLVANSRRSLLMTGPAGNGKTSIAKALHSALGGEIWIPYAIEVDGQVIKVFDLHNHEPVNSQPSVRHDQRWIKIKRPLVIVGGELTIETMDLIYSRTVRYYEAPFQMKSNGGTLVIDDFGRQRVDPRDLLNRWIIPLEGRVDYLTLHTGKKIQVPFEPLLIFATNLNPNDLVDDAFLRRMGYRLHVHPPNTETYALILQRYVEFKGLHYDPGLLDLLLRRYEREKRQMKCCEPRDLIERCLDICRYENLPLVLTPHLLEQAWANYFASNIIIVS
jgi:hypothetical protein